MSLGSKLVVRLSLVLILGAALLFIPAGSWKFWQGWAFLGVTFIPSILAYLYFYRHDPQLVERRLQSKEKVSEQKLLITVSKPLFLAALLLPGLDYRWGWSRTLLGGVPLWLILLSQVLVLAGFLMVFWVMKVNSFASRTIQVEAGQKVISAGPYGMVRHPLYSGSLVMWLATSLALGSYIACPAFALLIPVYVFRLLNEEKVLRQELPGYSEYCLRTRFRLVPLVW
ncbi:MAG TPA: isoprenylcysteine carboxylmethyltransferase family protein [Verrucomicrobiae bacterium]|nr:isoprenylcysteine carboxylmethyltransferase family protein [Verrucomicrobiae bacterium]